ALGMTWGVGTTILLFSNGVMLGAVALDYILAGQAGFLAGWLLPHGVVEIPAILLAGQAGMALAGALIGWGGSVPLKSRLREISGDLVTLISGVAIMLVWAGFIEAFFSQYHEPVIPYEVKIGLGIVELTLLILFLWKSGASDNRAAKPAGLQTT
ncbi:MAG: stage II sporulation protein M, partial [Desulfobulbaceae bacterium]|nr:stage II sporulation protein M [Desulfobulbaceae bacterium]